MTPTTSKNAFERALPAPLTRAALTTVQVNLGKWCNQACLHCHVEAGPKRTEQMAEATVLRLLALLESSPGIRTVDITGGAPEGNPHFRQLVEGARALGMHVIDRCNLTILQEHGHEDTAAFLAQHQVEVVASLPCYSIENVERQRGRGVFDRSIQGLRTLNALGYGQPDSPLRLNLVYNPGGPFLPPDQASLESEYRVRLDRDVGVVFHDLYTLTNVPIARFRTDLERMNRLQEYLGLLRDAFNPGAVDGVMCRSLVSVSWDGHLYDCDFNQMLELPAGDHPRTLWDIHGFGDLERGTIAVDDHCFACTAGAGSSCGGALV